MKSIFAAAGLMLAATAMPTGTYAQQAGAQADQQADQLVVVASRYQRDWDRGSQMEARGLRDLAKENEKLIKYSADVVTAQNERDNALALGQNAEQQFRQLTAIVPTGNDAGEALRWAKQLESAASDWSKHADDRNDGRRDLDRATERQIRAQGKVNEAQASIDQGRAMKAEAERLSQVMAAN